MKTIGNDLIRHQLHENRKWYLALGILLVLFSLILLFTLPVATLSVVLLFGSLMMLAGILHLFAAIKIFSGALRGLGILFALLYFLAGYYAFATPVQTAIVLTHLLAIVLIVAGLIRMMKAFFWKPWAGWGGLLLSGFLTTLMGILIFLSPEAPFWLLGLLLALDLMFQGIHYLTLALYIQQRIPKSSADV